MSGVGRDPGHHPIPIPCSGQGQLKHVALRQVLNISKDRDSTPPPGDLFSLQPVFRHNKKTLFLRFKHDFFSFSVPIAPCPSIATVEPFSLVARSTY